MLLATVSVGCNYIGLIPVENEQSDDKLQDVDEKHVSSTVSPYLKVLAGFLIPKAQITLTEILGKGTVYRTSLYSDIYKH